VFIQDVKRPERPAIIGSVKCKVIRPDVIAILRAQTDTRSILCPAVARELDSIAEMRGYPCMVVSDNGTELTSNAILKWQEDRKVDWHYIAPGKPLSGHCFAMPCRAADAERICGNLQRQDAR
jgi:hypothetical protein